jgi:Flp pilus assembly protein TadD
MGRKTLVAKGDNAAAVPRFQRAIRLDPNFAMAYASLGTSCTRPNQITRRYCHASDCYRMSV